MGVTSAILPSSGKIDAETDNFYHAATLMLEVGIGIAAADGQIDRDEVIHVSNMLRGKFRLSREYARRLEAYRDLLIKTPPSLSGLGKRIEGILSADSRHALGRFLVGVAASDGYIDKEEVKALKQLYRSMGVPVNDLEELLDSLEIKGDEPVVVQRGGDQRGSEKLPEKPAAKEQEKIQLNMALVEEIARDTAEVANMIGRAMGQFDMETAQDLYEPRCDPQETSVSVTSDPVIEVEVAIQNQGDFPGLSPRYAKAFVELLTKSEWTAQEVGEVAKRHALMPAGLIDGVNTWADEELGDFVIEGEGPFAIRHELLENKG